MSPLIRIEAVQPFSIFKPKKVKFSETVYYEYTLTDEERYTKQYNYRYIIQKNHTIKILNKLYYQKHQEYKETVEDLLWIDDEYLFIDVFDQ